MATPHAVREFHHVNLAMMLIRSHLVKGLRAAPNTKVQDRCVCRRRRRCAIVTPS